MRFLPTPRQLRNFLRFTMSRSKLNWDNLVGADGNYIPGGGGGGGGGSVLNYKGSVATAADLNSITDPQESDTYYVSSEGV